MKGNKNYLTYPCYITNGYLFAEIEGFGRALIDNGAWKSISQKPYIEILNERFELDKNIFELTTSTLEKSIEIKIDAIIGIDILSRFDFFFDIGKGEMTISKETLKDYYKERIVDRLEVQNFLGNSVPFINVMIKGKTYRFVFDTAAKLSFITSHIAKDFKITGKGIDLFPRFGFFETETRYIDIKIANKELKKSFGTLPPTLEATLIFFDTDGIIGTKLFDYFNVGVSRMREVYLVEIES